MISEVMPCNREDLHDILDQDHAVRTNIVQPAQEGADIGCAARAASSACTAEKISVTFVLIPFFGQDLVALSPSAHIGILMTNVFVDFGKLNRLFHHLGAFQRNDPAEIGRRQSR
jgi:hypothetical protein